MDETVEFMAQNMVYIPESQCLFDAGKSVVEDFLHGSSAEIPMETSLQSTSTSAYFEIPPPTKPAELYCYTCGAVFNNRKSLYRHGKATEHQTRRFKYNRGVKFEKKPLIPENLAAGPPIEQIEDLANVSNIFQEEDHENSLEKSVLTCYECGKVFNNRKAMYRHGKQTSHIVRLRRAGKSKGGSILCVKCEYSTRTEGYLRRHMQRVHCVV
uniref:C2H2-type domain-containing protein n=1 Tax=Caenorhabditis japonica TaxID=281687 RepID=A0A8R1ELE7_CAEJA